MAQERPVGAKVAPTELAAKFSDFIVKYDIPFKDAGVTNAAQWNDVVVERLLQGRVEEYISTLREISERTPEAKVEADEIMLEIMKYKDMIPSLNQMPVSEIATLDFVNNPDRQGTGGLNRDSRMFEAMLLHMTEQESTEFYKRYDEAFTAANLKDDFQPKIAILQLREGEENHNRRFTSLETLDRVMHEQPNCTNYELVYVRNAEKKAETEQEQERLNNQLYAEFNADTLRPRDYYGHSLSVGDVIVIANDFNEQHAYYVDDVGFTKLPDEFLTHEMSAKIRNDLDIRQEEMLYETIGKFEAENALSIMDKTNADRYFQITSEYTRIFELADRRGTIMDMDALGYEPAQVDGFSDDFLIWKEKDNENEPFGFDGWELVKDFANNIQSLMNNYTVQELQDRANGDYSVIEYGAYGDREVQAAINNYPQREQVGLDEYRRQVQAIYEYEVANNIPENDRMTKWYDEMNIAVAKPWYKENDPSVMDRAEGSRHIPISEASIAARYAEIDRKQQERNIPFAADEEPLVDIFDLEYDEDGYLHFTVAADDYELEGLYRIYDPENGDSMTLVSIDYGNQHPIIERQWDRIENALYDATIDRYNTMDRPTLAEDITNIKGVDRQYNEGMRETTYTFECDVRGVHDILTYEVSRHDDGEYYTIHTENNDTWDNMSEPELRKLEDVLSREAAYFTWQRRIENAVTENDLQDVKYWFMEEENLNLSQEQRERLYNAIDLKENSLQETERAEQIEKERSLQEVAQETERPVLMAGDIFEYEGKQYRVESNDGFMLSAENLDPNDKNAGISWIGTIEQHDYTLVRRAEREHAPSVSYFVAEAMEFHNLGAVHENISTIEEAINVYENLPETSRNMGNGIGAIVNGDEYSLYENGEVDTLEYYEDSIKTNDDILNAVKVLNEHFSNTRENEVVQSLHIPNMDLVANVQGIEFYSRQSNPTLIITYNENYHIEADEDVQRACERIFDNYYKDDLSEHLQKQKEEFERINTPIPNRYYEPALDLDGTAEELFVQARNGYIENPDALHRVAEILTQEGKTEEAERVGYMEEREREENTSLYSVAQMKLDFMDGIGGIDDVAIRDGLNLSVMYESHDDRVIVSLSEMWQDGNEDVLSTGASSMSLDEFKQMSRADFERFVGEVNAYNMVEQERVPSAERNRGEIKYFFKDDETGIEAGINADGDLFFGNATSGDNLKDTEENRHLIESEIERYTGKKVDLMNGFNHGDNADTRNPYNESNFKIQSAENGQGFLVRSDSERFGNNEIVFQGVNYDECLNYIAERVDNITPSYYVIKDLASWRHDVWEQGQVPERSEVERFDTVEEAIEKFNEYKGMDYLKESIINPDNNEPMRRLALGVSYNPVQMAEMDLLHTEADKTLLLSDVIGERENGYESFMTNSKFIQDLNKITSSITIDEYSYYRDSTIEELATDRLDFLNENYPEETHTREEAMRVAEEYIRQHPNYLRSNKVNERVTFADFTPPFLNKGESELNHGEYENITLHIKYQEPINVNGFVVETDTITFGSQEELNKFVNGEAAYNVLDDSVMKRDNEILLYAENENGDVVWGTKDLEGRYSENMTYGGYDYQVIDKWQDDIGTYVVGQLEADDGTWYAAKVTDTTEEYHGEYEYEFGNDRPSRSEVEDMHLNHISEIDIDRHEAEFGADGSRVFPHLNDPSPEEEQEELRQIVAEKSAPVEIDESLPQADQLKQRVENGVRQVLDSEQFKNWLATGGKLFYNNYTFRNSMLVWLQKPSASYVMGYETWKEFGRQVKSDAKGIKILKPYMAYEKYKGGFFRSIKSNLVNQLSKNDSLTEASYRIPTTKLEFTMNRANRLIAFKINGEEQHIFNSDDEVKRFIDRAIIGKVPVGYNPVTVFDVKDVVVPEHLWVKSGYTNDEIAPDEKGNLVKNRRGEVRIFNTPERQARFQTELNTKIVAQDPKKMKTLFDVCVAVSEKKGVPVSLSDKASDSTLNGGAKGYYSRMFTEDKPNGFIAIDDNLEITEKCAVLLHEMGHADLHKNLDALAKSMGEEKITKEMREVQAEATAFAVASTFGIETDTSSFKYLAAYARGFELQDFQKSLDVIYRETQALTKDIKAELDIRGLNLDLTEKPKAMLDKETLETLSTKYMDFATEQGNKVQAALNELPSLIKQSADNTELMDVLKYQKLNLDSRKADLDNMLTAIENLNTAETREKQDEVINTLDATMNRVDGNANAFEGLSERYVVIAEQARGGLKVDFEQNPLKTLEAMKKDYPALAKLSEPQLQYIATSKFVSREFSKLLRNNPQEFVDKVTERADLLSKAASKNGTFVEINLCEQWTDKPFFEQGTLCSPKIADKTVTGCEAQARGFSVEAEKRGEYFPYTKCDMTIFTPSKDGKLISLNTRIDIGDGFQTSLKEHLEQVCQRGAQRKEVLANFTEALSERAYKRQLIVQDLSEKPQSAEQGDKNIGKEGNMTRENWDEHIKDAKDKAAQEQQANALERAAEKTQNKSDNDRAD